MNSNHTSTVASLEGLMNYLATNNLDATLRSLKAQLLKNKPCQPSKQLISIIQSNGSEDHRFENPRKKAVKRMREDEVENVMHGLLNKMAAKSKIINDPDTNSKIERLMDQKAFKALVTNTNVFDEKASVLVDNSKSNIADFQDELDLVTGIQQEKHKAEISILPDLRYMPRKERDPDDPYVNDDDCGFVTHRFYEAELAKPKAGEIGLLASGCTSLEDVVARPEPLLTKKEKRLLSSIKHPDAPHDSGYPTLCGGKMFSCMNMKVIYNREKTGYEESREFPVIRNSVIAGRYQILDKLGSGAFATAVQVRDLKVKESRTTCLKILSQNKDTTDQGIDEVRLLRLIDANCDADKSHLLKYHSHFYHREHLFIETELLGQDLLATYTQAPQFFSMPAIKQTAKMLLTALGELHRMHIIHCDLKPENVLVKSFKPYRVKVVDFGNASFFHDDFHHLYIESRYYRAPELMLGVAPVDGKMDIWSLGCILAELWLKKELFKGQVAEMLAKMQGLLGPWPSWMIAHDQRKEQGSEVRFLHHLPKKLIINRSRVHKQHLHKIPNKEEKKVVSHLPLQLPQVIGKNVDDGAVPVLDVLIPKASSLHQRLRCDDEDFVDFLECLLTLDPSLRPTAEQALKHKFLQAVSLQE